MPLLPEKLNFHPLKIHLLCLDFTELKNRTFHQTLQFKIKLNCTSTQKMWHDKDPSHLKKNLFKDLTDFTYWYFPHVLWSSNWSVMQGLAMGHLKGPLLSFSFSFLLSKKRKGEHFLQICVPSGLTPASWVWVELVPSCDVPVVSGDPVSWTSLAVLPFAVMTCAGAPCVWVTQWQTHENQGRQCLSSKPAQWPCSLVKHIPPKMGVASCVPL